MRILKQFFNDIFAFNRRQELAYAVLNSKLSRTNYAIGFTFQTSSKDFIS